MPIARRSHLLENTLEQYSQPGIRIQLANKQSALAGRAGSLNSRPAAQYAKDKILTTILASHSNNPRLESPNQLGRFTGKDIKRALNGIESSNWYTDNSNSVIRATLPLFKSPLESPIGVLILEQDASSLAATTNSALSSLILYSFIGLLVALLFIGMYSSWLSIRIRKLSTAASQAISESGQVNDQFPIFGSRDEIGDLSRSYAQLLSRLKEYTNYLRTLSSKLSHELRTPLAIVKSSLDNLEHESLSKSARTYAERAKEGTTRLSNILNSMSAASRVEQSIRSAELESIPCDELLTNLRDAYRDIFPGIQIHLNIQHDRRKFQLRAAGDLLVQMMDKLVDNAADFCPTNGLVELGLYRTDRHIIITVRNEGPPLPSHMQNQLFDSMVTMRETNPKTIIIT